MSGKKKTHATPDREFEDSTASTWECSVCTFHNRYEAFKCEMCDTRKGTATRKPQLNENVVEKQKVVQNFIIQQQTPPKITKRRTHEGTSNDAVPCPIVPIEVPTVTSMHSITTPSQTIAAPSAPTHTTQSVAATEAPVVMAPERQKTIVEQRAHPMPQPILISQQTSAPQAPIEMSPVQKPVPSLQPAVAPIQPPAMPLRQSAMPALQPAPSQNPPGMPAFQPGMFSHQPMMPQLQPAIQQLQQPLPQLQSANLPQLGLKFRRVPQPMIYVPPTAIDVNTPRTHVPIPDELVDREHVVQKEVTVNEKKAVIKEFRPTAAASQRYSYLQQYRSE